VASEKIGKKLSDLQALRKKVDAQAKSLSAAYKKLEKQIANNKINLPEAFEGIA